MFWKTKKIKEDTELLKMVQILELKVIKLGGEIELINLKMRKKIYKDVPQETEGSPETEKLNYNDGFDDIRKINHGSFNTG